MILNNTPQNEAILSNVGEIGEFRIRNSAKAFSILSSGLYANKIRAIIRELSCNAVDSHIAADKASTPFDVHLPNSLEPWFSIRDYGTGLDHEQVTNIYTTYFESTKTNSNEFIGALGLGSKSPFSYTDNFTVTAVKNGRKGIYSAFINGEGVPSIALMMEEVTEDPAGVEVKFSVNNNNDFYKFRQEASEVYKYFAFRPVVTGDRYFQFTDPQYTDKDIIPGVHYIRHSSETVAVMGNIAYPIHVPNADTNLGSLQKLLDCGLEMHFGIGELDFQASREGLSYVPQTIQNIKQKLEALNAILASKLAEEANKIENFWDRAFFLDKKKEQNLWHSAIKEYVKDTKFPLMTDHGQYLRLGKFDIRVDDLASKYNISINAFSKTQGSVGVNSINTHSQVDYSKKNDQGNPLSWSQWEIHVDESIYFVCNDLKTGATERAKYHWRHNKWGQATPYRSIVFVLSRADKTKGMDTEQFFKDLYQPKNILTASLLLEKPRQTNSLGRNISILRLEVKEIKGRYRSSDEMVWRNAGKLSDFDDSETYYYLPLSGFNAINSYGALDCKTLSRWLNRSGMPAFQNITILGVRKGDLENVKALPNWINVEDYIASQIGNVTYNFLMSLVLKDLDEYRHLSYNSMIVNKIKEQDSPYIKLVEQIKGVERCTHSDACFEQLRNHYAPGSKIDPSKLKAKFEAECKAVYNRYPLLRHAWHADAADVADYVNMIDNIKGI